MLTRYQADLHIHTLLSPCGEVEMIPPLIVRKAVEDGLDIIAITDHNSAENVCAVIDAAKGSPLKVVPGLEVESVEGVHVVCLFDSYEDALSMQELVYANLPDLPNQAEKLGSQMIVTADAEFIAYNERLLLASTELELDQVVLEAEARDGIAIPAHVDRRSYGLFGVLGIMPETPVFNTVEVSKRVSAEDAVLQYPALDGKVIIHSSDAHMLCDIGSARTVFYLEHRSLKEIGLAFQRLDGRRVEQ